MSAVEVETGRARPLSGGLWTLFSWLRRDEHSSSDSLSSVGSDRTAASFAFLGPGHYTTTADPLVIPPPGPPTDSYKKRVRDRNLRRQHDRDITLLRKYGLHGFDAFSLPNARRAAAASDRTERDRRATSELFQRRAHVPGKRRAPQPPSAPSTLNRRGARKRPAPQPPLAIPSIPEKIEEDNETKLNNIETLPMNSQQSVPDKQSLKHNEVTMGCKSEKYSKKESSTKEVKPRQDKSFLKQIFENRKRNSATETSTVKLLPSISELDKQAHEIIEKYKLKEIEHPVCSQETGNVDNEAPGSSKQVEAWICTRCLRKYNATVITCLYCLPLENALLNNSCKKSKVNNNSTQTSNSQKSGLEDKEKLKEILKEMKDSLPKNPMPGSSNMKNKNSNYIEPSNYPKTVEAATLRIGSNSTEVKNTPNAFPSSPSRISKFEKQSQNTENTKDETLATIENVLVTKPVVLEHTKDNIVIVNSEKAIIKKDVNKPKQSISDVENSKTKKVENSNITKTEIASKLLNQKPSTSVSYHQKSNNTATKLSSLLNPIYIPKTTSSVTSTKDLQQNSVAKSTNNENINSVSLATSQSKPLISNELPSVENTKLEPKRHEECKQSSSPKENLVIVKKIVETQTPVTKPSVSVIGATPQRTITENGIVEKLDQHSRRRNLITQLEQSIAKGDERAAADAAVKLAQLRLSCSVLSFSSQIVADTSKSTPDKPSIEANKSISVTDKSKTEQALNSSQTKIENATSGIAPQTQKSHTDHLNKANIVEKHENSSQTNAQVTRPKTETVLTEPVGQKKDIAEGKNENSVLCTPSTSHRDSNVKKDSNEDVPILVWVEDKETTRGPVQIHVQRNAKMGDLRLRAERSLGLAVRMQRWIIGRALCSDDATPLVTLAGPELSAPFYLCLVESETKETLKTEDAVNKVDAGNVYNELVKLEKQALVSNAEVFECGVCMEECTPGKGVILRECAHSFCNECLSDVVRHSEEPVVSCPAMGCRGMLQEREIKGLVSPGDYEKWLARGLAMAESGTRNAFHCRTRDCSGWALCEPGVRRFPCPVCKRTNCVPCQAIHEGETCEQNRVKLASSNEATNQTDEGTRALLDSLIARGEALECPECSAIITKKWGCDWIKCSACKTEICWVTRGRRWGPAGRGDTSGGCRCGVDGKKCHPSCGYCH